MNLLDAVVKEVIGEPYEEWGKWWVKVKANCWGSVTETELMFKTFEEANSIQVGHKFLT